MPICFSVHNVAGYNDKYNTILYREPILTREDYEIKYIVFFPGDYSNFFSNSIYTSLRFEPPCECTDYCYSYEALFWVISSKYLYDHIIFVKPSIFSNYFSTFSNFLNFPDISLGVTAQNRNGHGSYEVKGDRDNLAQGGRDMLIGRHVSNETSTQCSYENCANNKIVAAKSIKHLLCLLLSLNKRLSENRKKDRSNFHNGDSTDEGIPSSCTEGTEVRICNRCDKICEKWDEDKNCMNQHDNEKKSIDQCAHVYINIKEIIKSKLVLIGFSKGCTVLFSLLREANEGNFFLSHIDSIYFLDPGFNKKIYNTTIGNSALEKLAQSNLKIYIHSTPRQVVDETGTCIHDELANFLKVLKQFNIPISPFLHYINVEKLVNPLNLHFEILIDFLGDIYEDPKDTSPLLRSCKELQIVICRSKTCTGRGKCPNGHSSPPLPPFGTCDTPPCVKRMSQFSPWNAKQAHVHVVFPQTGLAPIHMHVNHPTREIKRKRMQMSQMQLQNLGNYSPARKGSGVVRPRESYM
ncbi:conserved protein, unknown function [Plasmodium ovale wallikeri]|uniref:Uncharacterized protein n=1 Tax=Plasmodium ovale wallikeri TaxID=864142 RepID=A0A1A8YT25_PLAOA|nr:conserved protein, unknown function [Plasmodium ovale wallikeri]